MKRVVLNSIIVFSAFMIGCSSVGQGMKQAKINCYTDKLRELKKTPLYETVMSQFMDTFKIMKGDKRYFGVPEVVTNKIDDAIFFKKDNTECLLIVLKKNDLGLVFGGARIVRGEFHRGKWVFKTSIDYSFSNDYFEGYSGNSFDNISEVARYAVLTEGEIRKKGCEIDDEYWFVELKR